MRGKSDHALLVFLRPAAFIAFIGSSRVVTFVYTAQARLVLVPLLEGLDPLSRDRYCYSRPVKLRDMVRGVVVRARHHVRAEPSPRKFSMTPYAGCRGCCRTPTPNLLLLSSLVATDAKPALVLLLHHTQLCLHPRYVLWPPFQLTNPCLNSSSQLISPVQSIAAHEEIVCSTAMIIFCPYMSSADMNPDTELCVVRSAHNA